MVKHCGDTTLEVWSAIYINSPEKREPIDFDAEIIQIEPGSADGEYIVEVRRNGNT